jgi:hypothetical protein
MKYDASENLSVVSVMRLHLKTATIVAVAADATVVEVPETGTLGASNRIVGNSLGEVFLRNHLKMPQRVLWWTT